MMASMRKGTCAPAGRTTALWRWSWLACAMAVGQGAWAQESWRSFTVDDKEFVAYGHHEGVVLLPARWQGQLVRDEGVEGPSCDFLYDQLQARAPRIAACREGRSSAERCDRLRRVIGTLRTYETDLARPRLVQGWNIDIELETMVVDRGVRQVVARELNIELAALLTPSSLELTGPPRGVTTRARFDDLSWSGQVVGLVSFDEPPVRYSDAAGRMVTQDHLVACGLLDGVVHLSWTQLARVTFVSDGLSQPFQGPPLDDVSRHLLAPPLEPPPFEGQGQWLADTVGRLLDEELNLLPGLPPRELTPSPPVVLDIETKWLASAVRTADGG